MDEMNALVHGGWVNQVFGVIWVFGWVVLFVVLKALNNRQKRHRLDLIHRERLAAIEKGTPLPELPDYPEEGRMSWMSTLQVNPRWPLGVGAISVLFGIGLTLALWLSGDSYHNKIWPFGLLGVFLGIGLFLHYSLTRDGSR